ncbi:hypothetical protein DTL42_23655 [Bremerella cremea]|uniref:HEAT repeat domain-containing protein n=1 Tax=Bremerella cremea TaxID=1031537 RepID=A0A368KNL5_9BACT|nr:hypothetical protein DTL42_23655 [Bremerella cremea]
MASELKSLIEATRDSSRALPQLLPIYRQAILSDDYKVRHFAVDSMLLRAGIAHEVEWKTFVEQLLPEEEYLLYVAQLGRDHGPIQGIEIAPDSVKIERRQKLVLWLIDHYPKSRIHQRTEGHLNLPDDKVVYEVGKSMWFKKMLEFPVDVDVLANAASFLRVHDPLLCEGFLLTCIKLEPNSQIWQRRLADLRECNSSNTESTDERDD